MVTIYNKSNRPVGVGQKFALPDKELVLKDKEAYCAVFDENGIDTGKKQLLPGLQAMERTGLIRITENKEEEKPAEKPVEKKATKPRGTKKPKEEPKEEPKEDIPEEE